MKLFKEYRNNYNLKIDIYIYYTTTFVIQNYNNTM